MALTDFGATNSEVLRKVPLDTSQVGASTEPVSTSDIDEFIQDASSAFVAVITRAGLDPDTLNDDTTRQVRNAIEAYAVAEVLDVVGIGGTQIDKYRRKYDEMMQRYKSNPGMLSTVNRGRVKSNVSTSSTKPDAEFIDTSYKY